MSDKILGARKFPATIIISNQDLVTANVDKNIPTQQICHLLQHTKTYVSMCRNAENSL